MEQITAWECVIKAREKMRLNSKDYINGICRDFLELHGDRCFGDDQAIIGGIAWIEDIPVTVIGQQKGRTTEEKLQCNFGMPKPEGYRKVLRLMKQANKFNRPIICFVDTPGAFCGMAAEERGQGEAIARCIYEMSSLSVPVLSIMIGEGGSGGALAMAVANEIWMLEYSMYSVVSPEGFASILWKDRSRAEEAADLMKLTAHELKKMNAIDRIIEEPVDLVQLKEDITSFLRQYEHMTKEQIVSKRYKRFRKM